ncbi:MAG: PIN domain-containing protein [Nanoarchaeota archaeon]|nr:PIN domain-containing protein [Nanoarchaeota archaeon]
MKELLQNIKRIKLDDAKNLILFDTCFVISILEHHKHLDKLKDKNVGLTSFNVEELLHVEHKLSHEDKTLIRKFLKHPNFSILEIPVHPGNWKEEVDFVSSVDKGLLKEVHDPSDAVLIAAAIKTRSTVLTKDKHHLFTCVLESFLKKYSIAIYKDLNFI